MIADLKPYSEYQESGLPWIRQIPRHWEVRRLRHVCDMRVSNVDKHTKASETPVRLCNYVEVYKNERIRESTRFMAASATEDERIRFGLHTGDVLITKDSEAWDDIGVPALVECEAPDLVCGYHLAILRPRSDLYGPFLHRALECHFIAAQFHVEAHGVTRYGLSHGAIQGVAIPLPPPVEQAAIVRFLDWANGRLERAIRAKRKVIALLNEQKKAIIHRAVTRGLDPSVPLRPSGIPWLGDIPRHWDVRQLGRFITLQRGFDITQEKQEAGSIPVVSSGGVSSFHSKFTSPGPGVIVGRKGSVGTIHFIAGPYWSHDTTLWVKDFGGNDPRYVYYVLSHLDLKRFDTGSANPTLNRNVVHPELVAFPPYHEQELIARNLDVAVNNAQKAISRLEREIELLREYRTRLVADVVTGKLDVREAAGRLPEEAMPVAAEMPDALIDETEAAEEEIAA